MSIGTLVPGGVYRVTQRFTDCRGGVHEPGETFTYHFTSYWGYDGGIMLNCAERRIDFQEDESAALIANFASHIEKIGQTKPPPPPQQAPIVSAPWVWWEIAGAVFLVAGSILIVATERPRLSAAHIAVWLILGIAVCWGGVALVRWWRKK